MRHKKTVTEKIEAIKVKLNYINGRLGHQMITAEDVIKLNTEMLKVIESISTYIDAEHNE